MHNKLNLDSIIWLDTNAIFLYPLLKEYLNNQKELGMNYLSLGSLRYDEKYFIGYIFNNDNVCPLELVSYIQYKMNPNKLTLNYMEVAEKYRGYNISRLAINTFIDDVVTDINIPVVVSSFSSDGQQANLLGKLQDKLTGDIKEESKRNIR